jgi:hypothetical protein
MRNGSTNTSFLIASRLASHFIPQNLLNISRQLETIISTVMIQTVATASVRYTIPENEGNSVDWVMRVLMENYNASMYAPPPPKPLPIPTSFP